MLISKYSEADEEDDELADLSSAESEDSDEEEETYIQKGKVKGKLKWDPSTLPY